jgi:DNA-binding Lrp family transcriptional regulator
MPDGHTTQPDTAGGSPLDTVDRQIINRLQNGLPLVECPYAAVADELGLAEPELLQRLQALLDAGYLSRFGPMYRPEGLGGAVTLAAMAVPAEAVDSVAETLNAFPEVAHNYERDHWLSLWFVLAVTEPERIEEVIVELEGATGYSIYNLPKLEEFYLGLRLEV